MVEIPIPVFSPSGEMVHITRCFSTEKAAREFIRVFESAFQAYLDCLVEKYDKYVAEENLTNKLVLYGDVTREEAKEHLRLMPCCENAKLLSESLLVHFVKEMSMPEELVRSPDVVIDVLKFIEKYKKHGWSVNNIYKYISEVSFREHEYRRSRKKKESRSEDEKAIGKRKL